MNMDKKALIEALERELSQRRFGKKGTSWYRQADGALQMVDLQKSSYGSQFFINLCCVPSGMVVDGMPTPKEHRCPVRIRLTSAFPESRSYIDEAFDLERHTLTASKRENRISDIVTRMVIPFLDHMGCATALKRAIDLGLFKRGMVNIAAQKHLGVS